MNIKPLELTILVDDLEKLSVDNDDILKISTIIIEKDNTDTRLQMFLELDSFGEYIDEHLGDMSIIYSQGVEFICIDTYKELTQKINKHLFQK